MLAALLAVAKDMREDLSAIGKVHILQEVADIGGVILCVILERLI